MATRIAHKIYETTYNDRKFEIDGQNHEFDSKEWQLFETTNGEPEWIETYPTKACALEDLKNWA